MVPLPSRLPVSAVRVSPTVAVPVMLTVPVRLGNATASVALLVTLPMYPLRVTLTVMYFPWSAVTRIYVDPVAPEMGVSVPVDDVLLFHW